MKKKLLLLVCLFVAGAILPIHAVLKERDLASTLANLRQELTSYHDKLDRQSGLMVEQQNSVRQELITVLNNSQQNALMLYSQKDGYIFDLTYACHQATEQYRKFRSNSEPFRKYIQTINVDVSRYDSLINDLSTMRTNALSEKAKIDRNVCLTLAINIRHTLDDNRTQTQQYVEIYESTEKRLKGLNDYANSRYSDIQQAIFTNEGSNYFKILSNLGRQIRDAENTIDEKYMPKSRVFSDWDGRMVFGLFVVLFIVALLAIVLSYFFVGFIFTWLVRHNKIDFLFERFMKIKPGRDPKVAFKAKRPCIIMAAAVIIMAIIMGIVRITTPQNFIIMACELLVEFIWLMGVILLSLLLRLNGDQILSGFRIYSPLMLMGFIVISFRIILIPNNLVNLLFPPILLICALWQWSVIRRRQKYVPKSDIFYSSCSLVVFAISVIASWSGYTLIAVQLLIWWIMQLTCILTITCASSLLKSYGMAENRRFFDSDTSINKTWLFRLIYSVLLPCMGTISIILSIYWAADVFNLSDTIWKVFMTRLIDSKNFTLSIYNVVTAVCLFFIFSYINRTSLDLLRHHLWVREQEKAQAGKYKAEKQTVLKKTSMWKNVIQVIIWGAWILITMAIFHINNSWLVAISAGLSTGIGFAMKDILENIYYGISLMAGRIKVGDYISIDGTRGTVQNISYVSTTLETLDGSIMAFQNSQLFTKNYKNLTKNHGNELAVIPIGVAYGSNAATVKEVIGNAVKSVERKNYIKYIQTVFVGFGDNSIDFKILAWVDSRKQIYAESEIMEAVYNALNTNNIEIPYPQRDIHIVSDNTKKIVHFDSLDEAIDNLKKSNNQ